MMFIGIDPGVSGAMALLDTEDNTLKIVQFPTYTIANSSGKNRNHLDHSQLADILHNLTTSGRQAGRPIRVVIEQVNAMPGQGVVSTFTFGKAYGTLIGLVAGARLPLTLVRPNEWKKEMRLTNDKDDSRRRASDILPDCAKLWPLKGDHNKAEATLLALYAARMEGVQVARIVPVAVYTPWIDGV